MAFQPPKVYPYGGAGLPKTRRFDGKRYYLYTWGPSKMPRYRIEKAKQLENASSIRQVKVGNLWVKYAR